MINNLIQELITYGLHNGLINPADEIFVTNSLLALFELHEYEESDEHITPRPLHLILEDLMTYAHEHGILEEDTVTMKDLFDTKIMGLLTPPPSVVRKTFADKYAVSPKEATDYYYSFLTSRQTESPHYSVDTLWRILLSAIFSIRIL